ncbi:right-handed parallel beta-helix repeat-containing protein [Blastococcus sp. SYSU D00820]
MPRAELTGRRLAVALLLVAVLPALLVLLALGYQRPELPPGPPAYNPLPLVKDPVLNAMQARELQRSRRIAAEAPTLTAPVLVPATFPETVPTLLLAPRPEPYGLPELAAAVPEAFGTAEGALLLRASIEIPTGSTLTVDGAATPDLRLLSAPSGFAVLIARGGTLDVRGTATAPVRISSWDPEAAAVDGEPADGRSFLLTLGGRMDVAHADLGHLGFGTGSSSGVAWRGADHDPGVTPAKAVGEVTDSVFHDNWFGAYTFEAQGMRFLRNTFRDNAAYGFDPHDLSNDFLVEGNVAHGNGRHGFIFSRGCDRNVMRDNVAYDNRGHGFMIDDGRSEDSDYAEAARLPSNDNQLIGNHAYDNDGSGIEIEGGSGNLVRDNLLERNHVGIRVKNDASLLVEGNRIVDSRLAGVDVLAGAGQVEVAGNEVSGGWASVSLGDAAAAELAGNSLTGASTPMVVAGETRRDEGLGTTLGKVFRWNPLLVLWAAILGIPAVLGVRSLARAALRAARRRSLRMP